MKRRFSILSIGSVIIFGFLAIYVVSAMIGIDKFYHNSDGKQTAMIKKTIEKAAVQCYALEGAYPPDLAYLQSNYGIQLNKEKFFYNYEIFASNIAPQVDVLPINRGGR